jgi:hypothetical protein
MSYIHFTDESNQEERIARLRHEVEKLGGNTMQLESMPADMEEEFLRHVLENSGLEVVPPDQLDAETLNAKLKETIDRMASMGAYLMHTDHLSDRALYEYLYHDGLREEAVLFPENPSYAYMIDLVGSGSEEDNQIFLKYYADEKYREQWASDWPADVIPDREERPFDRDRFLPQSPIG